MIQPIVSSSHPITLIGGADPAPDTLTVALKWGETVVCADGGANIALTNGIMPAAVIGDMDSIGDDARAAFRDVIHEVAEQNSTDFDKALRHVEAPLVLAVGFLGQRFDHSLAALHVLLKHRDHPTVLIGDDDILFIAPDHIRLPSFAGMRVSLMPITPARVSTAGLKWDILDGAMSMNDFIGSSNEATGDAFEVWAMGGLAIILPLACLGSVVAALQGDVRAG